MNEPETSKQPAAEAVTIKKYANRRLYNTATSSYVTLDHLCQMVKDGVEFSVYDAKSGDDITRSVLTQIIVEEESKSGQNLLPISFLRQLIGFYGNNMQWLVPKYLEQSMGQLSANQGPMQDYFKNAFGGVFPLTTLEEMGKQNMAMIEKAMQVFMPFNIGGVAPGKPAASAPPGAGGGESESQLEEMQRRLNEMAQKLHDIDNKS
ncbi:MAG: polyhydroxyalkanoate synthesis repressor PhaR [Alphaproteobacteria bacterium]|nr:polyhydroxyalkanoate synthesis repressor PhaR [Alphaproteobacteria bacterium]